MAADLWDFSDCQSKTFDWLERTSNTEPCVVFHFLSIVQERD